MSKIDRMQVMGIRSFGPKQGETIVFGTPLTLIVGWNGSGKTTIIECLKYATTGELPPNSKTGGAFIHDPKLVGEKEVMAQVKLSFRSTSGVPMVVSRKMQLTIKKASRTQKTLEGSLLMRKDGVKESVSSRVAELDQIVPQYLGVSKAILENVIFCHQEDSLWPMSEPANLKKKFDSIFEADKYTKAIDNIKVIRKTHIADLAVFKANEEHAKLDKTRGDESERKQSKLYDEMEMYRSQYDQVEAQAIDARTKSNEAYQHAAQFEQILAQLQGKRVAYETNKENVASLEDNLKTMMEADEELEVMMNQYGERVQQYNEQQDDLKSQYRTLQAGVQESRNALGVKQSEVGKHEAEKDQHARNLQKREVLIMETAKRHNIRGFDHDVAETQVAEFQQILRKLSRNQNKTLDRTRSDAEVELNQAQTDVNGLSEQKAGLNQRKELAKSQITANDKRIADLQNAMSKIRADEGAEAIILDKKKTTETELKKANADVENANYDARIQDAENTVSTLDEKKERLDTELFDATQLASESAQVDYTQNKLKETKHSLETMKSVHSARITQLVDPDWDVASLANTFRDAVAQKSSDLKEAESRREIAQDKLNRISFQLSSVESEQKKKRAEYGTYKNIVLDAIQKDDIADFEETLQELEESYEIMSSDQAKIDAQLEYMKACLQVAEEHNQCRLCKRTLKDDKTDHFTKAKFLTDLKGLITKASSNANAGNTEDVLAELEKVRNAKPSFELAKRAEEMEMPALKNQYDKLILERNAVNKQLEEHDNVIYDLKNLKQEVDSLSADVQSIVSYYNQARELEDQIDDLKKKQKAGGLSRGITAVREDLQRVMDESRIAKVALATLNNEREKLRKHVNALELYIRDVHADLSAAQSSLKEKRNLAERMEEFRANNADQREAIREFETQVERLDPQLTTAQGKYEEVRRRGNERVNRIQEDASKLADSVRQLAEAEQDIASYIDKGGPHRLAQAQREIESLHDEIQRMEQEMSQVARDIKHTEEALNGVEHTKQSIFDNLRYRRAKRTLETLEREIEHLGSQNAEHDHAHWIGEGERWHAVHQQLNAQQIEVSTTMKEKDIQLQELIKEYNDHYKNAAKDYREAYIKVETTKAACEDLARYGSALEQAILKFHSLKMDEINKIIDELWRNAYQGTDVDTVRIRSDNEGGARNRTYNYRVVMVKRDNEMDMRGRCSAGQKVLASIVIRLALAECFGTNCGLIALDEPTTNLDQQNIKGLAESLSQIIQIRRKQANFQLLVITHDEQFLREMNCGDYTDVYWRVGRDRDQESYIERQNISEVA
ncbi:DNA repair protein rad50 [Kalmusia sp. IMI 367209]|nr:DNA repair protein rad50 [Kalmusia sp. IMI 367209]